jgi:hypothetical protein
VKRPISRRYFVKQSAVVGTGVTLASSAIVRALSGKKKADVPVLGCAGSTGTSIDIQVCTLSGSGATGAPAGFSIQWMTAQQYATGRNAWCEAGFSGEAAGSRYNLNPGDCVTVRIGDLDSGASTTCTTPLVPGTVFVFRAFAHANRSLYRSDFSSILRCIPSALQIPVNAADPLLLRATAPDGRIIDYFGTRDANGLPLSLNLIEIRTSSSDSSDNPLRYLLDSSNRPVRMYSSDGTRFDLSWLTATQVALTVRTADGKTQVNTSVDLSLAPAASGASSVATLGPSGATAVSSIGASSFKSNTVARAGRHVILQHTPAISAVALNIATAPVGGTSSVNVEVDSCGGLSTGPDEVYVRVLTTGGDFLGRFPAARVGDGQYVATLPSGLAPMLNVGELCGSLAEKLGFVCDTVIEVPGTLEYLCAQLTVAVAATVIGALFAAEIFAACELVMAGLELYCKTLNVSGGPGTPSLAERLCESPALDRTFTSDVLLVPLVIALPTDAVGIPRPAHGNGPFPNLLVDLGGNTTIRSISLNPPNPGAQESYIATADIFCLPAGTVVTMSIVGTDGYTDSVSTTIQTTENDGKFTLFVPGAATAGIRDVDTATVVLPDGQRLTLSASLVFG